MPEFKKDIQLPGKTQKEIFDKVRAEIEGLLGKNPSIKLDIKVDEPSCVVSVASKWINVDLKCLNGEVQIDGNLSLFAIPFRSIIETEINKWVEIHFKA